MALCDTGADLLSVAVYLRRPQRRAATHFLQLLMQRTESTQTLPVRVLRLVSIAAAINECGLPMYTVAGLKLGTLYKENEQTNKAIGV